MQFGLWFHFILKMILNSLRENPCKIVNLSRNTIKSYRYVNHFSVVVDINFLLNFIKDEIVPERFCRLHQVNKSCTFIFSYTAKFYWPLCVKKLWRKCEKYNSSISHSINFIAPIHELLCHTSKQLFPPKKKCSA